MFYGSVRFVMPRCRFESPSAQRQVELKRLLVTWHRVLTADDVSADEAKKPKITEPSRAFQVEQMRDCTSIRPFF